ncbi:MAG: hypothetical protein WDZ46_09380 [Solirubrobacterales bacterium]
MKGGNSLALGTVLLAVLLQLSPMSTTWAGEMTRGSYVEEVEPICKAVTLANRSIFRGTEQMIRNGKLRKAAPRFPRAATAVDRAIRRMQAVPRPPRDRQRLARWLRQGRSGSALLRKVGVTLKKNRRGPLQGMAEELLLRTKRVNATVVGFDFEYCRLNPSRFT